MLTSRRSPCSGTRPVSTASATSCETKRPNVSRMQLALFEAVDHVVERLRDEAELVVALDVRAIVQIAAQHFAHAGDQPLQAAR